MTDKLQDLINSELKKSINDELKCPICQDLLYHPVTLFCQHSFCKLCLKRYKKENPTKKASCPMCKLKIFIPPIQNTTLNNIIDLTNEKENLEKINKYKQKEELKESMYSQVREEIRDEIWRTTINETDDTHNSRNTPSFTFSSLTKTDTIYLSLTIFIWIAIYKMIKK
jgi:hypothetical protein